MNTLAPCLHRALRRQARGLTIMEVMLATFILSVCALTIMNASYTSASTVRQSAEYASAVATARQKMEEIQSNPFDGPSGLVARYGVGSRETTFKVFLNEGTEQATNDSFGHFNRGNELIGFRKTVNGVAGNTDAGEVVIVLNESAASNTYGYSCSRSASDTSPDGGQPGGIGFNGLPMDLNGDGNTSSGTVTNSTATRLPVGVVIRWDGPHGPERYELWTIISRY